MNCNRSPVVPAPRGPWSREVQSPLAQTLYDASVALQLDPMNTYLSAGTPNGTVTYNLTMPPGNYAQQVKRIYIPTSAILGTATWIITGTFAGGFTTLTFNATGFSAWLEWDGSGWHLVAGNAQLGPS